MSDSARSGGNATPMSATATPADVSSTEADEMIDAEWTWLYDDHDAGTVFITDDPENQQFPIAEGLTAQQATDIIEVHNKTVRALAEAASLNTSASRSPAPEVVETLARIYIERDFFQGNDVRARACAAEDAADFAALPAQREPTREWETFTDGDGEVGIRQREPARAADAARHTTPELRWHYHSGCPHNGEMEPTAQELDEERLAEAIERVFGTVHGDSLARDIAAAYRDATREPALAVEAEHYVVCTIKTANRDDHARCQCPCHAPEVEELSDDD